MTRPNPSSFTRDPELRPLIGYVKSRTGRGIRVVPTGALPKDKDAARRITIEIHCDDPMSYEIGEQVECIFGAAQDPSTGRWHGAVECRRLDAPLVGLA